MALVVAFGCGGPKRPADMPKLRKIEIQITQNGVPLEGAAINLAPKAESKWSSGGVTDASGVCRPRTGGKFQGTPEGSFDLTISKIVAEETGDMTPGPLPGQEVPETARLNLVDPKYAVAGELTVDVTSDGPKKFSFDLGDAVREPIVDGAPNSAR